MEKNIFVVQEQTDLERCYPVIKELRPHLEFVDYVNIYNQSRAADGYQMIAYEVQGHIVAVMGYRFLWDFVRGQHLYIDDLVSTGSSRSLGYGTELLKYAETIAEQAGCKTLRLCTGLENERGVQFYERNHWTKRAYAYVKKIKISE